MNYITYNIISPSSYPNDSLARWVRLKAKAVMGKAFPCNKDFTRAEIHFI
jgi:hypothetical protein